MLKKKVIQSPAFF